MCYTPTTLSTIFTLLFIVLTIRWRLFKRNYSLVPGPRQLPFIGNALLWPNDNLALNLEPWKKQFGKYVFVSEVGSLFCSFVKLQATSFVWWFSDSLLFS